VSDADPVAFRQAAGQFAGGIVVVTTSAGHAMTVSEFVSVSLEPPLVLFCAEKAARFHDAVVAAGVWAVSILAADAEKTARWLGVQGRPLAGHLDNPAPLDGLAQLDGVAPLDGVAQLDGPAPLDGVAYRPGPVTGAPLLDGALATLECVTDAVHDGGDHTIVVGRVTAVAQPPAADGSSPLVHYAGTYRHLRPLASSHPSPVKPVRAVGYRECGPAAVRSCRHDEASSRL
jgi:flavin reductase (DIM6/NTAB) family NADH-FMN oxidoreductase RutF